MAEVLQVERREKLGTAETRRLRGSGRVPAVLYGHGEQNEHLSISEDEIKLLLRHHSKTVKLKGALTDTALVSQVQWDPLGIDVIHLDLIRVNLQEQVEVTVPVSLSGDAPGVREGGILLENKHDIDIRCPAGSIPEAVLIDINDLHVGQNLTAGDAKLPEGAELVTPVDDVIVRVEALKKGGGDDSEGSISAEPEVIAKGGEKEEE